MGRAGRARRVRSVAGPAGRGPRRRAGHPGRAGRPGPAPAASRWGVWAAMPPGPSLSASPGRRPLVAGRHQAVLLRRPGLHPRAGDGRRPRPGSGCSRRKPQPRACGRCRGPGPRWAWRAATPWTSGSSRRPGRAGRAAGRLREPARLHATAAPGWPPAGTAGPAGWPGRCWPPPRQRDIGPHGFAHLGAVDIALRSGSAALDQAADEIDSDPLDRKDAGARRALRVRTLIEAVATEVLERVGRALGAGPLGHDGDHARQVADLTVYLRQHHAERDLEQLGTPGGAGRWWLVTLIEPHPIDAPGTAESEWRSWRRLHELPVLDGGRLAERGRRGRAPRRRGAGGRRRCWP